MIEKRKVLAYITRQDRLLVFEHGGVPHLAAVLCYANR
jgi:hypothetical protein